VFAGYSSRRVLVMEFIEGALMADYLQVMKTDPGRLSAWLAENNIDQRLVARQLFLSILRQSLEENLYHGDLHPGNIILLRDSRIVLIDCGTVGFLEREYLEKFRLFVKSLADLDYDKAADLVFLVSAALHINDLEPMKGDLVRAFRAWGSRTFVRQLSYDEKSVASIWQECLKIYLRYKCGVQWQALRFLRAITTLDASFKHLYPDVNYTELQQQYFRDAQRRQLRGLGTRAALRQMTRNLATAGYLPEKATELAFFQTGLARRQAKRFEGAIGKVDNLFAVLFANLARVCLLTGIIIVLVLLDRRAPTVTGGVLDRMTRALPTFESDTWLLFLILDAYLGWTFTRLRRRFGREEVGDGRTINV